MSRLWARLERLERQVESQGPMAVPPWFWACIAGAPPPPGAQLPEALEKLLRDGLARRDDNRIERRLQEEVLRLGQQPNGADPNLTPPPARR